MINLDSKLKEIPLLTLFLKIEYNFFYFYVNFFYFFYILSIPLWKCFKNNSMKLKLNIFKIRFKKISFLNIIFNVLLMFELSFILQMKLLNTVVLIVMTNSRVSQPYRGTRIMAVEIRSIQKAHLDHLKWNLRKWNLKIKGRFLCCCCFLSLSKENCSVLISIVIMSF